MTGLRLTLIALLGLIGASAAARPAVYRLPAETARLPKGPNLELATARCVICHSADYITTQPRRLKDPDAFWRAEITKMKKVYGAPIEDEEAGKILAYLTSLDAKEGDLAGDRAAAQATPP